MEIIIKLLCSSEFEYYELTISDNIFRINIQFFQL